MDQSTFTGAGRKEGPPPPVPVHPGQPESGCSGARGGRNATQKMDETELILRESIPRQADKKSRSPQGVLKEEIGVWNSRGGGKDKLFFPLHSLGLYNNNVSCLRTVSGKNLLANPVILKCKLWEWV